MGAVIAVLIALAILYFIKGTNKHIGKGWGEALSLGFVGWIMIGIVAAVVAALAYATSVIWVPLLVLAVIIWALCKLTSKPKGTVVYKTETVSSDESVSTPHPELRRVTYHKKMENLVQKQLFELIYTTNAKGQDLQVITRVTEFDMHVRGGVMGVIEADPSTFNTIFEHKFSNESLKDILPRALEEIQDKYPKLLTYDDVADLLEQIIIPMEK